MFPHPRNGEGTMQRHPDTQLPFDRRLTKELAAVQEQADKLPPGPEKDALLTKIRQLEVARHINEWLASPGLRPPT
jgi:hypothetical protein